MDKQNMPVPILVVDYGTSEYTDRRGVTKCTVMYYSKCAKLDCLSEED